MDFIDLAKARYSVRKFSNKPIEKEKIALILEVGKMSPTARNDQSQRILVVDDPEKLDKIKICLYHQPYQFAMPMAMLICYDHTVSAKRPFDNQDFGIVDATIVAIHMMLEISDLGLGSTFMSGFNPDKLRKELSLPLNIIPVALLPMGYPAENSTPSPSHEQRLDISKTVFYNSFPYIENKK